MDLTDVPDVRDPDESPPALDALADPDRVVRDGAIRERLLDVVVQLREPATVATVADRADCDAETARTYLAWFAEIGVVREHGGRPVRYERNDSYLRWRRVERIRDEYTDEEIAAQLEDVLARIDEFRDRFDADGPADVSLLDADEASLADAWRAVSAWRTAERRAALLDEARRRDPETGRTRRPADV